MNGQSSVRYTKEYNLRRETIREIDDAWSKDDEEDGEDIQASNNDRWD